MRKENFTFEIDSIGHLKPCYIGIIPTLTYSTPKKGPQKETLKFLVVT